MQERNTFELQLSEARMLSLSVLVCLQVLGLDQCEANKLNTRALGLSVWRSRCLERRGIASVNINW